MSAFDDQPCKRSLPELQFVNARLSATSVERAEQLLREDLRQATIDIFFNPDPALATILLADAARQGSGRITEEVLDGLIYWPVDVNIDDHLGAAEISQGWALSTRAHALKESRKNQGAKGRPGLSAPSPTSP